MSCAPTYTRTGSNCSCTTSQTDNGSECADCGSHCLSCASATNCTQCEDTYTNDHDGNCSCASDKLKDSNNKCAQAYRYFRQSHIDSLIFDDTFSYLTLTLSVKLVQLSGTSCSLYILNPSILGTGATCAFTSDHSLAIYLGSMYTVTKDVVVKFSTSLLTIDGAYSLNQDASINFQSSYNTSPTMPSVVITGPTSFSSACKTTTFTYYSSGSSGDAIKTFTYFWYAETVTLSTDLTYVDNIGNSFTVTDANTVTSFHVYLTITNVFGLYNSKVIAVNALSYKDLIEIRVDPKVQTILYSSSQLIQASVSNFCSGSSFWLWINLCFLLSRKS